LPGGQVRVPSLEPREGSMTDIGSYLVGRKPGCWPAATMAATDMLFAASRKDDETLEGLEFEHCTFANISFKNADLTQCRFTDCAFLSCYFRKCEIVGTSFVGCKFISCNFAKVTIQSGDFKYSHFEECSIPFAEMEHSLPREPNLRQDLARDLAIASDAIGAGSDGRRYRLAAIQAREEHLHAAILGKSSWYQNHYPGLRKLYALGELLASRLNGIIWGHGEKWHIPVINLLVLGLIAFPAALWLTRDGLQHQSNALSIGDIVWLSVTTIIPIGGVTSVVAINWMSRILLAGEALVGVAIAGLLVTILVRRMLTQ